MRAPRRLSACVGFEGPRHELVDAGHGMSVGDGCEGVAQVGVGIDGVELAGLDERGHARPGAATFVMAREERILAVQGDRPDRVLDRVSGDMEN